MSGHHDTTDHVREAIRTLTRDPVTKLLLAHSQLTLRQLETILADSFSREGDAKKALRQLYSPSGRNISRGAFNRSLTQAQNNVIRSIYTVLLLGHLGLYDSPSLQPFIELADTIRSYVDESREAGVGDQAILRELNLRLIEGITSLARRQSFKDRL
jgi:hypothetical protein